MKDDCRKLHLRGLSVKPGEGLSVDFAHPGRNSPICRGGEIAPGQPCSGQFSAGFQLAILPSVHATVERTSADIVTCGKTHGSRAHKLMII